MKTKNPINYRMLISIPTFEERVKALFLHGFVGEEVDAYRYFRQAFYKSKEWKDAIREVHIRDNACDLAHPERPIVGPLIVHHIDPITLDDIEGHNYNKLLNPENLITTSDLTHKAIHYGDMRFIISRTIPERKPNDTIPWR